VPVPSLAPPSIFRHPLVRAPIVGVVSFIAATWLGYEIASWLQPPRDPIHPVMPIGAALVGLVTGLVVAPTAIFSDYLWQRRRRRRELARFRTELEQLPVADARSPDPANEISVGLD